MTHYDRAAARKRMFRRRRITVGVAFLLLLAGAYTALIASTPLHALTPQLEIAAEVQFDSDASALEDAVAKQNEPSAVGWLHDDEVWSNTDKPQRIASITKLVTVMVALEAAPIEVGADGPTYTNTQADADLIYEVWAQDGITVAAPIGLELTTRQLLQLTLLPSANNYSIAYANWVFGSNEKYVAAVKAWLSEHGLESVKIFEPSGLNDSNVASPADVVRIARLALANPVIAEIISQKSAQIPVIGTINNTNQLLKDKGVIGLKTGTTFPNGYSLAAAKQTQVGERELVAIAVSLSRADRDERDKDTRATLKAIVGSGQEVLLATEGEHVGSVTTWMGDTVPLVIAGGADTMLVPGESASRTISLREISASKKDLPAGQVVGAVAVVTPAGDLELPVETAASIVAPDLWWKLTHPREVLGF